MPRQLKRFLVNELGESSVITLDRRDSHHLRHVLRLKLGDPCYVSDSKGRQAPAVISSFLANGNVEIKLNTRPVEVKRKSYITVAQALPQRGIMDRLVQKAGELGVAMLIPMITKRTQLRISEKALMRVMDRWMRIAHESAKQSGNPLLEVGYPTTLQGILERRQKFQKLFIGDPQARPLGYEVLASDLSDSGGHDKSILIFIGPEGGFTDGELGEIKKAGGRAFSLFGGILKTETAFVSIVSLFRYFIESGKSL